MDGKDICKKKLTPPRTKLDRITLMTDFGKKMKKNYPKKSSINIFYNGNPPGTIVKKGAGSYGSVYIVRWDEKNCGIKGGCSVAVKIPIKDPFSEIEIINDVLKGYRHHIIPYHIVNDQWGNPFVVMQEANGDLFDLLKLKISTNFRDKIILYYTKAIGSLWKKGIVFGDIKSENLLYQCFKNKNGQEGMAVYFGDIGSFSKKGEESYGYEVDPPEDPPYANENLALFTIGLLIISIYDFLYERPKNDDVDDYIVKFYNPVSSQIKKHIKNKKLADLTLDLISWDSSYRDTARVCDVVREIKEIL